MFMNIFKPVAAGVLLALGLSTAAQATTVATFDASGDYSVSTGQFGQSTLEAYGLFDAQIVGPIPTGTTDYEVVTSITIDSGTWSDTSMFQLHDIDYYADIAPYLPGALAQIVANAGTIHPLPGGVGTLTYGGSFSAQTATQLAGDWWLNIDTIVPISAIVAQLILELDPRNELIPAGYAFPDNGAGNFAVNVTVNTAIAPIPLPATAPLLGVAMLVLAGLRRRHKAA